MKNIFLIIFLGFLSINLNAQDAVVIKSGFSNTPTTTRATVIARGRTTSTTVTNNGAITITSLIEQVDSTNSYNPSTGDFVAPHSGYYLIDALGVASGSWSATGFVASWLEISGNYDTSSRLFPTIFNTGSHSFPIRFGGSTIVKLDAGAIVKFRVSIQNSSSVTVPGGSEFRFMVKELPEVW